MLLYAGNTSISSFKYSIFIDRVKKLKQWSQSAGNTFYSGTSETIRNNIEYIKNISIHVPRHLKPLNDEQFGHYLAGLIDGDGHFSSQQQLVIVFSSPDVQLAYYIKKIIGFGKVKKVKYKNAYLYIISNRDGILKAINFINNKLRTINKYNQVINILENSNYSNENIEFGMNNTKDFNNHWIAGFSDADASFQIKIITSLSARTSACARFLHLLDEKPLFISGEERSRPEIRLNFQIVALACAAQKENSLLLCSALKEVFGGNISFNQEDKFYTYTLESFGSVRKLIKYFDCFHLQSSKQVNYLKWRKAYIMIQNKDHLTEIGVARIKKLKQSMNRSSI